MDDLLNQLYRSVELPEYSNIAYMKLSWFGLVWEIQCSKDKYMKWHRVQLRSVCTEFS